MDFISALSVAPSSGLSLRIDALNARTYVPFVQYFLGKNNEAVIQIIEKLPDTDQKQIIKELTTWSAAQRDISKFQGLVDIAEHFGAMGDVLGEAKPAFTGLVKLVGAADSTRFEKLFKLAKDSGQFKHCLITKAEIYSPSKIETGQAPSTSSPTNDRPVLVGEFALLSAAAYANQTQIGLDIINKIKEEGLLYDVAQNNLLPHAFRYAALNGNTTLVQALADLATDLEQHNEVRTISLLGADPRSFSQSELITYYNVMLINEGKRELAAKAGYKGLLLAYSADFSRYKEHIGVSPLRLAIMGGHKETAGAILALAKDNEALQAVIRAELNVAMAKPWDDLVNETLAGIRPSDTAIATAGSQTAILAPSKSKAEMVTTPPSGFNHELYEQLLPLMQVADGMENNEGKAQEWARKLASIFDNIDQVRDYLEQVSLWGGEHDGNQAIFNRRLMWHYPKAPEVAAKSDKIINTDFFALATQLSIPESSYNRAGWQTLMLEHPETARYISQADKIDEYVERSGKPFPKTIEELREVVFDYGVDLLKLDTIGAQMLRAKKGGDALPSALTRRQPTIGAFPISLDIEADMNHAIRPFIDHLGLSGIGSTLVRPPSWHKDRHFFYFVRKDDNPPGEDCYGKDQKPGGLKPNEYETWSSLEHMHMHVPPGGKLDEVQLIGEILSKSKRPQMVTTSQDAHVDLSSLEPALRFEVQKQIYINTAAMGVSASTLHSGNTPGGEKLRPETKDEMIAQALKAQHVGEFHITSGAILQFGLERVAFGSRAKSITGDSLSTLMLNADAMVKIALDMVNAHDGKASEPSRADIARLTGIESQFSGTGQGAG